MTLSEERATFNADEAAHIAASIGIARRSPAGRSTRFSYFEDDERFLVVAGPQEADDIQLALLYGMTWAGTRRLLLALPREHSAATRQRLPWFAAPRRPELWLHDAGGVERTPDEGRDDSVRHVVERLGTTTTREEFVAASTVLHVGSHADALGDLVDWATGNRWLDAAHRQGQRSWHCMGLGVLSVQRIRDGVEVRAGVHGRDGDRTPLSLSLTSGAALTPELGERIRWAVEDAIARRMSPDVATSLHRPDEHWLQAVLRQQPSLVGIEQPALREVPAWRPHDTPAQWSRGYVDLLGLDGHGDVRLVETKLTTNDDPLVALQALDYLAWASAYRDVLTERLGASSAARINMTIVVGADEFGAVHLSPYSRAVLEAVDDDIAWSVQGIQDWFGPSALPFAVVPGPRALPAEWTSAAPARGNPFSDRCRASAVRWKERTTTLPEAARESGARVGGDPATRYAFCLPAEFAVYNLLPDVREEALALFVELGIPWHQGIRGRPSNHLLSSQVQCVNALARMVHKPGRLAAAFSSVLDIADVLPIEEDRYLTFEFIGSIDVLGESRGGRRLRGAQNTSVDAAFLYRTPAGATELALVEWKYTEEYRRPRAIDPAGDRTRVRRYEPLWLAEDGPLRTDVVPLDDMLVEPFYQLMRQQLLTWELEKRRELGAEAVRVVHVLAPENAAYQQSLTRPSHQHAGSSVDEVWFRLLRRPDRFVHLDPAVFLDPAITSDEYVLRYG